MLLHFHLLGLIHVHVFLSKTVILRVILCVWNILLLTETLQQSIRLLASPLFYR